MSVAKQNLRNFKGANLNIEMFGGNGDGVFDNWNAIRSAVAALKKVGGRLTFPRGRYRVRYDASDATRIATTGVIDLSPWSNSGVWTPTENIEIYFDNGAVLFMDNLMPNGYDAQTHAIFAQCRWTNSGGAHTPNTWTGYSVSYGAIRLVNVTVEWALGSARGAGDSFHFAGTKSKSTAPYDITLENCSAYNAPQVGTIFMGCKQIHVTNFYAEDCWADTCHFNACFEGCTAQNIKAVNCGDDTLAVVTYYPDVITLALGLDTEVGPFTSPDQVTANNNGLQATNIQKIGGRANAVRLFGANRVLVTNVYADAAGSVSLDAALWAGSVKANGTTLAQSGMANIGCQVSQVIARNGVQVGVHLVALGFIGSEGDTFLRNDTTVRGINVSDCVQVSVWGHDCDGFAVDGVETDSVSCDFSNAKNFKLDNLRLRGQLNITGSDVSYAATDIDTMPWHHIQIGSLRIDGAKVVITDTRGLTAKVIAVYNSPAASFEGIRLSDFTCPEVRLVGPNRSGTVALANIPFRCIPGHRWAVHVEITHDATAIQNLIEVGGGDANNITSDVRINGILIHEVGALADDPWEIQGSTYAPVNFWRTSRCRDVGTWKYVNTDDLPLGIVPEIAAVAIAGTRTLKVYDAIAVFATGVLSALSSALSNLAAVFAAREIRFMQFVGDEGSAGVIDYGEIQPDAMSIHGKGTSSTNRKLRLYDNVVVNGTVDAAGQVTAADVKVTNTTGSQPARLDSDKKVKGGKINVTSSSDIDTGTIPGGSIVIVSSGALAALGAFATGRILGTNDTTGLPEVKDVDLGNSAHVTVPGSTGDLLYNGGGLVGSIAFADFEATLKSYFDTLYAAKSDTYTKSEVDTLLTGKSNTGHTHTDSGHTHGGVTAGSDTSGSGSANIT